MLGQRRRQNQLVKEQSKWSPQKDVVVIESRRRVSVWDEERKNKLAQLYAKYEDRPALLIHFSCVFDVNSACRYKPEMWAKVAEELGVPMSAAEAMHWQLGEEEMAKRDGVVPFSSNPETCRWSSQERGHGQMQSQSGVPQGIRTALLRRLHRASHQHELMPVHRESVSIALSTVPQQYSSAPRPPPPHRPVTSGLPSVASTPASSPQPLCPPSGECYYQLHGLAPVYPNKRAPDPLPGVEDMLKGASPPAGLARQQPPPPSNTHHLVHQKPQLYADQWSNLLMRGASQDMRLHEGTYRRLNASGEAMVMNGMEVGSLNGINNNNEGKTRK